MKLENRREFSLPSHCCDIAIGDAGELFVSCYDGGVYRVNSANGEHEKITSHENYVSSVNWSSAQKRIVSSDYDGELRWTDPAAGRETRRVKAHDFWSWRSRISPDGSMVASSTGQYLCGGYKYEPAAEREPSVKVFDVETGYLIHALPHLPPVESVAFSNDGTLLAAGNLMGEVRIWDVAHGGKEIARLSTPDFTGWGIIKGHYYTGGIFSLAFAPDDQSLYLAGMGSTRDPAAGNGKQLWQRFVWNADGGGKMESQAGDGDIGQGLMEALTFHPDSRYFVMAGRLFKGEWNTAVFDAESGKRVHQQNTELRTSAAEFSRDGSRLFLAGGRGQGSNLEKEEPWGRVLVFDVVK